VRKQAVILSVLDAAKL